MEEEPPFEEKEPTIDLTQPEAIGWMQEEAGSLQYRDQVTDEEISNNARKSLYSAVREEIEDRDVENGADYEELAQEAINEAPISDIEDLYREAVSDVEPSEVASPDFTERLDASVAVGVVDNYLEE